MEELLPCPGCGKHNGVLRDRGYGLNESTFEYWVECAKCLTIRSPMCKTPEAMHEEWGDDETPLNALFRLYKRVRMATILDADD